SPGGNLRRAGCHAHETKRATDYESDKMSHVENQLRRLLAERILLFDGAMGTMIQRLELEENDFRGERFANHRRLLKGCNDLLCITQPDAIAEIHAAYIEAGADIVETNTFNSNAVSVADYGLDAEACAITVESARLARRAVEDARREAASTRTS